MQHLNKKLIAIIALACIPITGLSIDIYVPSLPAIHSFFGTTTSLVQLTITAYLIGFGALQLVLGPLSDTIGRRKPIVFGVLFFAILSLAITFSPNIYFLLILRFLQGVSVAAISVSAVPIFPDLFEGKQYMKYMSITNVGWALSPVVAPYIGGYLESYFGWRSPFYFLFIYGLIIFFAALFFLKETHLEREPFHFKASLKNYCTIGRHKLFFTGLICLSIIYGTVVIFSVVGPFLIQNQLHYSPIAFGRIALAMGIAILTGNLTNRFFLHFDKTHIAVNAGFAGMMITGLVGLYFASFQALNLWSLSIPVFLFLFSGGMIFPYYYAKCAGLFPKMAATANALIGSLMIIGAGVMTALASLLRTHSSVPLMLSYVVLAIPCLATKLIVRA